MPDTNCPNCGAPKHGSVCEYCGTSFARFAGEAVVEVNYDTVDIYDWSGAVVYRVKKEPNVNITVNETRW